MAAVEAARRNTVMEQLEAMIAEYIAGKAGSELSDFARLFHETTPAEDLEDRNLEDIYAALVSIHRLLTLRDEGTPRVRVFNPSPDADGWS